MAPSNLPPNKFAEGEKVLCFHGPLIYQAKCLKYRWSSKEETFEYFVHYAGWNKNWDEWVRESRILKLNDTTVAKQKDLQKSHTSHKKSKSVKTGRLSNVKDAKGDFEGSPNDPDSRSSTPNLDSRPRVKSEKRRASPSLLEDSSSDGSKRKRTKPENFVESEIQFVQKLEVKIKMPDELKPWLVDDMLLITRDKKQSVLPAKYTIETILDMYLQNKRTKCPVHVDRMCSEVMLGVKDYFNAMFPNKLLYKLEKSHIADFMANNQDLQPVQYCGSNYLLRLFVRLGSALAYTVINEKSMSLLVSVFHDLLKYLASNTTIFFSKDNYA